MDWRIWKLRPDVTDIGGSSESAASYNEKVIASFRAKANHNKHESQITFTVVVVASLASPLFVSLGQGWWDGKVIPAVLSLGAAAATSWLQLRKPQRLWALYRQAQRRLEDEQVRYRFGLSPFDKAPDPDKLLAENTAKVALEAHYRWEGFVPDPDALGAVPSGSNKRKSSAKLKAKK